jgi:YbgC/YbaW family acyl-CoA thioester hydrolase
MILLPGLAILRNAFRPRIESLTEMSRDSFFAKPTDIDVFRHVNNARYLRYMEAGRWGLMVRLGLLRHTIRRGWIAPLRAIHVEYYRPLSLGQRFEIGTQYVRFEERWFYVLHRVFVGEKEVARALAQATVRRGRENVPPSEYLAPLGYEPADAPLTPDVEEWVERHLAAMNGV